MDMACEREALTPAMNLLLRGAPEIKALARVDGVVRYFICDDSDGLVLRIGMVVVPDPSPFPTTVVVKFPRSINSLESAESVMASKADKYDFSDIPHDEMRTYTLRVEVLPSATIEAFVAKTPAASGLSLTYCPAVFSDVFSLGPIAPPAAMYSVPPAGHSAEGHSFVVTAGPPAAAHSYAGVLSTEAVARFSFAAVPPTGYVLPSV